MTEQITIVGAGDGFGGLIMALSCAHFTQLAGHQTLVVLACNDIVFDGLYYLFFDKFKLLQIPEEEGFNNRLIKDPSVLATTYGFDCSNLYIVTPDLVFSHNFSFDAPRFNTTYSTIKSTRLLTHRHKPEKIISLCLNTSTPQYVYPYAVDLIKLLSTNLPNYKIYYPLITEWAGHSINQNIDIETIKCLPNVVVDINPNFVNSLKILEKSEVCVCCDNGPSHCSYHLGNSRVLLEPHLNNPNGHFWASRWRETLDDSIDLRVPPDKLANLITFLTIVPQIGLLPKYMLVDCHNYSQLLGIKTV